MALGGDLCDGGSAHHSAYLLTNRTLSHRTTVSAHIGLRIGNRRDDFESQPAFGTSASYRHLTDGNDRGDLEVKPLGILCV